MKSLLFFFCLLNLYNAVYAQQDSSGVYVTAQDYKESKLSYAINCKTQKHKINQYVLLGNVHIKVIHDGVKYKFYKSEIFGYRDFTI